MSALRFLASGVIGLFLRGGSHARPAFGKAPLALLTLLTILATFGAPTSASANNKYAAIVVDGYSGKVLYSDSANAKRYPASLTKIMTLYLLFEEMDAGRIKLDTRMKVSRRASNQQPSRLGLRPGDTIRVEDAILALVTKSANDVAVVVAEHIGGSEKDFARRMTAKAHALGMSRTRFQNASGLPDRNQYTTARDMATLAQHMREDFPHYYGYFSAKSFSWKGQTHRNHNKLLGKVDGVNGIKTGYIAASGFNLTTTVERDGKFLVAVVMGGKTGASRDRHMVDLIKRNIPTAVALAPGARPTVQFAGLSTPVSKSILKKTPVPQFRPEAPILVAAATPQPAAQAPTAPAQAAAPNTLGQIPVTALAALAEDELPGRSVGGWLVTPAYAHEGNPSAPVRTAVAAQRGTKTSQAAVVTRRPSFEPGQPLFSPDSWIIQIGAFSDPEQAVQSIRTALVIAPNELSKAVPITVPVAAGEGKMLYRSRFGGFDETAARNACGRLVREKFSCIPIPPRNWTVPTSPNRS